MSLRLFRLFFSAASALLLALLLNLALAPPAALQSLAAMPAKDAATNIAAVGQPLTVSLPFVNKPVEPILPLVLGTLGAPFNAGSAAIAVNNRGEIAGDSYNAQLQPRAFLWRDGIMTGLGALGGATSSAVAINDAGQIAGNRTITEGGPEHAFFWAGGVMTDIGVVKDGNWSVATALNNRGQVVGFSGAPGSFSRAFVWANGVLTPLPSLGGLMSRALDINDAGQVVGISMDPDSLEHVVVWKDGALIDLGFNSGSAVTLNERGQVAGIRYDGSSAQAFLWENGAMTTIGGANGIVRIDGLNEAGEVVGYVSANTESGYDAFVWRGGSMTPLKTYLFTVPCPVLIDDAGDVVALDAGGAVLHRGGQVVRLAGPEGSGFACAHAINNAGQVVGRARSESTMRLGVVWEIGE